MQTPSVAPSPFVSAFDREFDVVVFGAGLIGFAAARELAGRGLTTLLLESSGDVLWEATRALENSAADPTAPCPEWTAWLGALRAREGADEHFFEPALAEIFAARELSSGAPGVSSVLLYAAPVAVERTADGVSGVVVATKGGPRRVRAKRWVDASEKGDLARLAVAGLTPRAPVRRERSLLVHTHEAGALDEALARLTERHPGVAALRGVRPVERRLRWTVEAGAPGWYHRVPELITELRSLAGPETRFVVSLCAMREYPIYAEGTVAAVGKSPANLLIASPALRAEAFATPADRFAFGVRIAADAASLPAAEAAVVNQPATLPAAETGEPCDVLVAGVGTGGSHAVISAARAGAKVKAIDFTSWPGGVGTGAGICGYFHGAKGGLQSEVDARAGRITELLTGVPSHPHSWHHEAKKMALLALFEEAGAEFIGDVLLAGVERNASGRVLAALAVVDGRLVRLPAATFVDGTGDADLAAFAGAEHVEGRPGDGRSLAYSQSIFSIGSREGQPFVRSCNFDAGWVDPIDVEDLTRARITGISQHLLEGPWTKDDRALAIAPWIGLRQSRQIVSDYMVTLGDLVDGSRFTDSIGEAETVADTHSVDFEFETDEMAFYYWTCRGFRHGLRCDMPYGMMLPRGLENVWVACRAAGIAVDAAYGLRMQRDLQRLGEAAGLAAAQVAARGVGSREVDIQALQAALAKSGALDPVATQTETLETATLVEALDRGLPGVHIWHLFRDQKRHGEAVRARLASAEPRVSFYAAAVLAMWGDVTAEPRLLEALRTREVGPAPEEKAVPGAFAQCIDLPYWMQAVVLLRRVGTEACLPTLTELAGDTTLPFNARTTLALTLERLAQKQGAGPELKNALEAIGRVEITDGVQPPSRSMWRPLQGEPQKKLANDRGASVAQDHGWQLRLVLARARGQSNANFADARDSRAFVRRAFASCGN